MAYNDYGQPDDYDNTSNESVALSDAHVPDIAELRGAYIDRKDFEDQLARTGRRGDQQAAHEFELGINRVVTDRVNAATADLQARLDAVETAHAKLTARIKTLTVDEGAWEMLWGIWDEHWKAVHDLSDLSDFRGDVADAMQKALTAALKTD